MANAFDRFDVLAEVKAPEADVLCAAHPTEAQMPNYNPPFRQKFVPYPGHEAKPDMVLQHVGEAHRQTDGSYRIELSDQAPHTKVLFLKPRDTGNQPGRSGE